MSSHCDQCSCRALWTRTLAVATAGLVAFVVAMAFRKKKRSGVQEERSEGRDSLGRIPRKPLYPGFPWKRPPPGWVGRTLEQIWDDEDAEYRHYITTPSPPPPSLDEE
jgi:hypothetical protein